MNEETQESLERSFIREIKYLVMQAEVRERSYWAMRCGIHSVFNIIFDLDMLTGHEYSTLSNLADDWASNGYRESKGMK